MSDRSAVLGMERKGRVLTLVLNRQDRGNSLNPPLLCELRERMLEAQADQKINAIILTGAGNKDFSTGIDVISVKDFATRGKTNLANVAGDIATLIFMGKPVIVAVNGRSMGMGVVFACAADYRLGVDGTEFRMPEVNLGAFPGASCIAIFNRVCGLAWTRRILMTGEPFTTRDALDAHLIDKIVPREALLDEARTIAKELARKNSTLLQAIKHSINRGIDLPYAKMISLESDLAEWYTWKNPSSIFSTMDEQYSTKMTLTGDPVALLEEYSRFNPD